VDQPLVLDQAQLEPCRIDLPGEAVPEPCRCFSFEQLRGWGFGDRVTSRLRHIPDVGGLGPDHLRPYDLARSGLLTSAQTPPRLRIRGRRRRETTRYRGIDHVARLTLLHLSAERLPLPVAGDRSEERRVGQEYSTRGPRGPCRQAD